MVGAATGVMLESVLVVPELMVETGGGVEVTVAAVGPGVGVVVVVLGALVLVTGLPVV